MSRRQPRTRAKALADLAASAKQVRELRVQLARAERTFAGRLERVAGRDDVTRRELAQVVGLSAGRVSQLLGPANPPRERTKPARPAPAPAEEAQPAGRAGRHAPADLAGVELHTAVASTRALRRYNVRTTAFVNLASGQWVTDDGRRGANLEVPTVACLLERMPADVERVYLVGPRESIARDVAGVRGWFTDALPDGWQHGQHYLADADLPVGRYVLPANSHEGRRCEVHRMATWFGALACSIDEARSAMGLLDVLLGEGFPGQVTWLSTPTTTGRDLWQRTISPDHGWQVFSAELRELIQSTAGQGRTELLPAPRPDEPIMPGFAYLDGRLMYAGLTWGMPVAPARWWTTGELEAMPEAEQARLLRARGRWLVEAEVPTGWSHVGLLMAPAGQGAWEYPREPRRTFRTWADGAEVWLARQEGWRVRLVHGVSFAEGKPLNAWTDHLVKARERADTFTGDRGATVVGLVRAALRSCLLNTLGGFAQRRRDVWRAGTPAEAEAAARAGTLRDLRRLPDGRVSWTEPAPASWSQESMAHPEWAAQVWARARVRLLRGPGGTGALVLPRDQVVAFRTDALYVTRTPAWGDDGRPGRLRRKGVELAGPLAWPDTWDELFRLRDRAEAGS